jgi:ATPase family associated with various cellular activities (AAA)
MAELDEIEEFSKLIGTDKKPINNNRTPLKGRDEASLSSASVSVDNAGVIISADSETGESRWSESDGLYWRAKRTHQILSSGRYECLSLDGIGPALRKKKLETDDLLALPETNTQIILKEFEQFWKPETKEIFDRLGYIYKRGFFFWGPQGSGKTSTLNLMMKTIIEIYNGIIIDIDRPDVAASCLLMLRKNEPERPLITVGEDLDALIERYGEAEYLSLYDGADQVSNVIHIVTTNYPQRIDRRFVDRPSRFDTVEYIGMPGTDSRRMYFRTKMMDKGFDWFDEDELERWVSKTENFSISHLKEMVISVCGFGKSIDSVIERMKKLKVRPPDSDKDGDAFSEKIGFRKS